MQSYASSSAFELIVACVLSDSSSSSSATSESAVCAVVLLVMRRVGVGLAVSLERFLPRRRLTRGAGKVAGGVGLGLAPESSCTADRWWSARNAAGD